MTATDSITLAYRAGLLPAEFKGASAYGGTAEKHAYRVVEEWHRESHPGRFDHCDQQPCAAIHIAH